MKSGASESSYIFLKEHIKIPSHIHISHIPQDLYSSTKKVKILWAQHAYDQPFYINFNHELIDLIVCPSNWAKKQMIKYHHVPNDKIKVINTGVNKIFSPSTKKEKTFIYTSIPYKGLELLPKIFPKILEKHPDAKLKVFSSMSLYDIQEDSYKDLYDQLKSIPNVEYSPAVDQKNLIFEYQKSAFFIHPNIWEETFCVSLAEAMTCGCYPIITDIGAIPEVSHGIASIVPIEGFRTPEKYEVTENFINNFAQSCIKSCDIFDEKREYYLKISNKISNIAKIFYDWKFISKQWQKIMENYSMDNQNFEIKKNDEYNMEKIKSEPIENHFDVLDKWEKYDFEFSQGRSNFQLEKFFLLEQHTIPNAFFNVLKNRRAISEAYINTIIEIKRKCREFDYKWNDKDKSVPIEWQTNTANGIIKNMHWYDLDKAELEVFLKSSRIEITDRLQQICFFDKILYKLIEINGGKAPTKEEFEDQEHIYWERRLAEQSFDDILSRKTGINQGNLHSMRRGTSPSLIDPDKNVIKNGYPDLGLLFDENTSFNFIKELQEKIVDGISEVTGVNVRDQNKFDTPDQSTKEDYLIEGSSIDSFYNENSGINFYSEE